ncbi:MAG: TnpV protein [Clostridiales bacterium]|jgi:hypothetical protein|nr:TnpV protein [Clostridiales bacterium]
MKTKAVDKGILYVVLLFAIVALFGFLARFTNNFTTDFKSFYVEKDGEGICCKGSLKKPRNYSMATNPFAAIGTVAVAAKRRRKDKTMEITYTRIGDYLLPSLVLSERRDEHPPLGRYARMRKAFLKEHRPMLYSQLLLSEKLFPHLREIDEAAQARLDSIPDREQARAIILAELVCN